MTQQVEFPVIPGVDPDQYQNVITALLGFVKRESPNLRELRRHMRSRSLFDKDTASGLFELLGINLDKTSPATLQGFGVKLFDIDDPDEWRLTLFREIARRNEILIKYVFDALNERLYSVNEMFRVLTSYVYPGTHISLVNFKNWMKWIEATQTIKYIGIRWGPSELAKKVEPYLLGIDIEEILEDEAEGLADGEEWTDDSADSEFKTETSAVTADDASDELADPPDEPEATDLPPEPELPPDLPPEAPPVPAPSAAMPGTASAQTAPALDPLPTYQYGLRLSAVSEIQEVQKVLALDPAGAQAAASVTAIDEAELAFNVARLREAYAGATDREPLGFKDFGINPVDYKKRKKNSKAFFLYRGLVAATCAFRRVDLAGYWKGAKLTGQELFQLLDESGALTRHFHEGQPLDDVISALMAAGHGSRLEFLGITPFMALARQGLAEGQSWCTEREKVKDAEKLWAVVYERLHAGVFDLELIWLVRELYRTGLWPLETLAQTGVVPSQDVLDVAYSLGFLDSPYIGSFASVLFVSRRLSTFFGEDLGFEAALQTVAPPKPAASPFFSRDRLRR